MFIKICGITKLDDAQLAVNLGATAIGFIFAPSKRKISPERASKISSQLPNNIEKVGVFVNEKKNRIHKIARQAGLTAVQLHGDENQSTIDELAKSYKVIKSVKIDPAGEVSSEVDFDAWKILLDTYIPKIDGGSGVSFNWDVLKNFNAENIIVAGGLNPENITGLLSLYKPFGIDVSSGVEMYPGKKDPIKLEAFLKQVTTYI